MLGMPVLEVWKSKMTVVMKRGRGAGYSGVDNPLFVRENNRMFFGSAKPKMEELAGRYRHSMIAHLTRLP